MIDAPQFHTSVTEKQSFQDCRRRWWLETHEHLAPRSRVPWALEFGTLVHTGLEDYYRFGRDASAAIAAFDAGWKEVDERIYNAYGKLLYKMGMEEEWYSFFTLGRGMLDNYAKFDRSDPWFDEVVEINLEQRGFAEILSPRGRRLRGRPLVSGRIDLVVRKDNDYWVWDHKTAAQKPSHGALDLDDQGTGYCYITYRTLGIKPRGFLYNVLLKRLPSEPKLLASGKLSVDKRLCTTREAFMDAIKKHDLDPGDYREMLDVLHERGYSDFFVRDTTMRNFAQLEAYEQRLYRGYRDMKAAIETPALRYPNMNQRNCGACSLLPLCLAMEDGGNVDDIKDTMYEVQEPRVIVPDEFKPGRPRVNVKAAQDRRKAR